MHHVFFFFSFKFQIAFLSLCKTSSAKQHEIPTEDGMVICGLIPGPQLFFVVLHLWAEWPVQRPRPWPRPDVLGHAPSQPQSTHMVHVHHQTTGGTSILVLGPHIRDPLPANLLYLDSVYEKRPPERNYHGRTCLPVYEVSESRKQVRENRVFVGWGYTPLADNMTSNCVFREELCSRPEEILFIDWRWAKWNIVFFKWFVSGDVERLQSLTFEHE